MATNEMWNVLVMGFAFMFIFTAFQTTSMIEPTVLESFKNKTPSHDKISGYTRCLFIASLIEPYAWSVYLGSVIIGYGASVIWTGQGNFLTINSTPETISRNSGIFWALLQSSLLFGNMYVYYQFKTETNQIENTTRRTVYTVFTTICGLGICLLFLLQKPRNTVDMIKILVYLGYCLSGYSKRYWEQSFTGNQLNFLLIHRPSSRNSERRSALESLKTAGKLLLTKDMLLLSLCFAYTGIELTFFSGVYGTCVGNTSHFHQAKRQIGLVGMLIGCGEISGGLLFGIFGKRSTKFGREPIVLLGMISHWICFLLIFFNLPDKSPLNAVQDNVLVVFHHPRMQFYNLSIMFCLQIYSILGSLYEADSAPAFALFKFFQSLTAAIAFFYSLVLYLKWQLLIMVISSLFGTVGFFLVEWKARRNAQQGYAPIS
ncbi:PREDICTED: UNC93-like protein MFSD11 [Acropora digitifera]|uniref:UNC93-like protein MFSD11 n=1 Tax=Acropora digitifera TaxID=70779 RepID=UPI00077A599E|nr:PREDICTED: UNC93-like protein MFSD11 [Acropora digitifera]